MYIIRHTKHLWVFAEDHYWGTQLVNVKEYATEEEAIADAIKLRLSDYLVQSTKDFAEWLFKNKRIIIM